MPAVFLAGWSWRNAAGGPTKRSAQGVDGLKKCQGQFNAPGTWIVVSYFGKTLSWSPGRDWTLSKASQRIRKSTESISLHGRVQFVEIFLQSLQFPSQSNFLRSHLSNRLSRQLLDCRACSSFSSTPNPLSATLVKTEVGPSPLPAAGFGFEKADAPSEPVEDSPACRDELEVEKGEVFREPWSCEALNLNFPSGMTGELPGLSSRTFSFALSAASVSVLANVHKHGCSNPFLQLSLSHRPHS